ncbi:MAG: hypothetical protein ACOC22_02525 [bacterium]
MKMIEFCYIHLCETINDFSTINLILTLLLVIITGIYTYITYTLFKSQFNPLLYAQPKIIKTPHQWNKLLMQDLDPVPNTIRGLSKVHIDKKIELVIINDGVKPAHSIELKIEIITYKNIFEFGMDEADVQNVLSKIHKKAIRIEKIDYIAPKNSYNIDVCYVSNYPMIEVYILKLKSNELKYLKKKTRIFKYRNSDYIELSDSEDYRNMIGV